MRDIVISPRYERPMSADLPTKFDGTQRLFQIGLKPLDLDEWIDADERLGGYLAEKERLQKSHPGEVFAAEPGTRPAQAELLALLVEHLPARFPDIYQRSGDTITIASAERRVRLDAPRSPLEIAASLVQEDLVLLRNSVDGWRIVAATLCFPSAWKLREKFAQPIHEVHGPVPGFGPGSRNAELIGRMFDNLRPATPVIRWNWSAYGDAELFHPESSDPRALRFGMGERAETVFLRVERQTLRKLPVSGDIVFTIRLYVDPLETLARQPDAAVIARRLVAQIEGLDARQLSYKGLTAERDRLLARLREFWMPQAIRG
jgi:hypothetical protein